MKNIVWMVTAIVMSWSASLQAEALKPNELLALQHAWAHINYELPDAQKEDAFAALDSKAHALSVQHKGQAGFLVWEAIIKSTYAGAKGGLGALDLMEHARDLLLQAESMHAESLNASIYTSLGSFYYMVPGWPIGFGDDDKAEDYLTKALNVAPDDMDANYFSGDYWLEEHKYKKAAKYLQKVVDLPALASRPVYSKGRKAEAAEKLKKAKKHIHS